MWRFGEGSQWISEQCYKLSVKSWGTWRGQRWHRQREKKKNSSVGREDARFIQVRQHHKSLTPNGLMSMKTTVVFCYSKDWFRQKVQAVKQVQRQKLAMDRLLAFYSCTILHIYLTGSFLIICTFIFNLVFVVIITYAVLIILLIYNSHHCISPMTIQILGNLSHHSKKWKNVNIIL